MISYKSIYLGWAPNYDPYISMAYLNGATGQKGATYNVYTQLQPSNSASGTYDGNGQYYDKLNNDIISSGAVLIASLMPNITWTEVNPGLCSAVASFFEDTFTSQNTTVWLRFAHEVNYYASDGSNDKPNTYPGGVNYGEFMQAWACMYDAVKSNDKIYMYWSPNWVQNSTDLEPWFPPVEQVQIVGVDYYPNCDDGLPSFDDSYSDFYNTFASPNNLTFAIGETGTKLKDETSAPIDQREAWLKTVINQDGGYSNYPLYTSATWYEDGPPGSGSNISFYVVYDQSEETVQETISNTEAGSA